MPYPFAFGERQPGYDGPVLNEREARAGAGILLAIAAIAFARAWHLGDFAAVKIVSIGFLVDFAIRVLVTPKLAPSLVLGRLATSRQTPEFTGAAQKRFAWSLGLILAATMTVLVVGFDVRGPINLLICVICLTLLFFEAAFGICIGCAFYRLIMRVPAELCPGGACEVGEKHPMQRTSAGQIAAAVGALALIAGVAYALPDRAAPSRGAAPSANETERCKVPEFAKRIGHEEMWKLHNNCK